MLVGDSEVMQELRSQVARVARTSFTVLIEGESGSGKELVACEIHTRSPRADGPFVALNCAALVESLLEAELFGIEERTATGVRGRRGKFEQAHGGTLFLDEVGDLSATAQAKLLRVLQDMAVERVGGHVTHVVDVRVVAATNRGLWTLVNSGGFRADLYYRLSGVDILVPPLRDHREDIPALIEHFLRRLDAGHVRVTPAAVDALLAYDWPGNVRQLGRVIERAIALSTTDVIDVRDLPAVIARRAMEGVHDVAGDQSLRAWTSRYVRQVLARCDGNKRRACEVLDISYHTLRAYLEFGRTSTSTGRPQQKGEDRPAGAGHGGPAAVARP